MRVLNWKWNNSVGNFVALDEANKGSKMLWVSLYVKVGKSVDGGAVGKNSRVIKTVE